MTWTYIARTEHAKLKLTVDAPIDQQEWNDLSAALRAWEPAAVSEGAATVTRLLSELEGPGRLTPEQRLNTQVYLGPADPSVMGLTLRAGEVARIIPSHRIVHADAMHRWTPVTPGADDYQCGHGGCHATAHVEQGSA